MQYIPFVLFFFTIDNQVEHKTGRETKGNTCGYHDGNPGLKGACSAVELAHEPAHSG